LSFHISKKVCCSVSYNTWLLTLREEHTAREVENRVLRLFLHKREEIAGEKRKIQNGKLHNLNCSKHIRVIKSKKM
jgi:hypothetical protein